jgi:serine/threonine protein kinase
MLLRVIGFIAFKYHKNDLFHGDIKPDNIFFDDKSYNMTTDVGSLLYLGERNENEEEDSLFIATSYTE